VNNLALRYSFGTVLSRCNQAGGQHIVKIAVTGVGMNAGEIPRIFKAFAQGDHAAGGSSCRFGGLGLGLAISKNLVELHSGKIETFTRRDESAEF
jgi:signal transduction histidine kinase